MIYFKQTVKRKIVTRQLAKIFEQVSKQFVELGVVFCGRCKIKTLNSSYAGQAKVTDVLSFLYQEKPGRVGEIFICLPVAQQQAAQARHSLQTEISLLFVHGVVHLLGYDHQDLVSKKLMKTKENRLLKKSGLNLESMLILNDK